MIHTAGEDAATPREATGQPMSVYERIKPIERRNGYNLWKRGMDLAVSIFLLILFSPIMIIAAIAIAITDPGPILFKHKRIGRKGRPFGVYKFRTMCIDAEKRLDEMLKNNPDVDPRSIKFENDPRITKVGKFLRKTSIDEMPQLFNVLRGEMSMVGPRPMVEKEVAHFDDWMLGRFLVKPGITCYWQIMGRSLTTAEERMALDQKYLDEMGFWTDLKILAKTPWAVIKSVGAG